MTEPERIAVGAIVVEVPGRLSDQARARLLADLRAWREDPELPLVLEDGARLARRPSAMPVVYLAHRLSGDWAANTASARRFAEAAARRGFAPVAPYLTLDGLLVEPDDRELGLAIDFAMIAKSDAVWLCGPTISAGMELEADEAIRLGVPLYRWLEVDGAWRFLGVRPDWRALV